MPKGFEVHEKDAGIEIFGVVHRNDLVDVIGEFWEKLDGGIWNRSDKVIAHIGEIELRNILTKDDIAIEVQTFAEGWEEIRQE